MKTTIAALMALLLVMPAEAQQRRAAAPAAPAESVWGRSTGALSDAFNRSMAARQLKPRLDAVICDVTTTLACEAQVRGVQLRVTGTADPEQIREIRVPISRANRTADVALVAHTLMEIMEPAAPEGERRDAMLALMGIGRAQVNAVTVGRTEARFADSFAGAAFVFRPAPAR